jgi:hypothetical protein
VRAWASMGLGVVFCRTWWAPPCRVHTYLSAYIYLCQCVCYCTCFACIYWFQYVCFWTFKLFFRVMCLFWCGFGRRLLQNMMGTTMQGTVCVSVYICICMCIRSCFGRYMCVRTSTCICICMYICEASMGLGVVFCRT